MMIGRDVELDAVRSAVSAGRSVIVRGVGGVGKSTLIAALCDGRRGDIWLHGLQALRTVPYVSLRLADIAEALDLGAAPEAIADHLVRLLPAGALLVVDDMQWCDLDSQSVVCLVAAVRAVVATMRPEPAVPDGSPSMSAALLEIAELVDLGPLDGDSALAIARDLRPAAPASDVQRWVDAAAGNPLTLALLAGLGDSQSWSGDPARRAVEQLDAVTLEEFAMLALAGVPSEIDAVARADLIQAGLIRVDSAGHCRPRHDLVAEAAIDLLETSQRRRIHRRIADSEGDNATRAVHYAAAGEHELAVTFARSALARCRSVWSRAEFLGIVAEHLLPPDPTAMRAAAGAYSLAGRYSEALALLARPELAEVRRAGDDLVRARASWAITEIAQARDAIASGLVDEDLDAATESELLSLRSRIRCRVDWDLPGAIEDGLRAKSLAAERGATEVSARSALGLAYLMSGDAAWQDELHAAGQLAIAEDDVHNAVTVFDTMLFGHLLSGDPTKCAPLAAEMIEFTERVSPAWNGYFRASALLTRLLVSGDCHGVLAEASHLGRRPLTVKSREALRTATSLALIDSGAELDAADNARLALRLASDDSARAMASWTLAEAAWLSGDAELAVDVSDRALDLNVQGFPGAVNAALAGQWARHDLGRPMSARATAAVQSGFPNLRGAAHEMSGLNAESPAAACAEFEKAALAWQGVNVRAAIRSAWAAAVAAVASGDEVRALQCLDSVRDRAAGITWLDRRVSALVRRLGVPADVAPQSRGSTSGAVMRRIARGQTTAMIARALIISPATVDTHVRNAMRRTGARTRMQAAALEAIGSGEAGAPTLIVTNHRDGRTSVSTAAVGEQGGEVFDINAIPPNPWQMSQRQTVTGTARTRDEFAGVALALVRGASLDVDVAADNHDSVDELFDVIRRRGGRIHVVEPVQTITETADRRLVELLARGETITSIASELGYSRRTIQRRLLALREAVGASANSEAVIILSRQTTVTRPER